MKTLHIHILSIISCLTAYPASRPSPPTQYIFIEETVQLNCSTRPGQARSLYSAEWNRNNIRINDTTFSLSVPVQNVSQNGTVYQCTVTVQSCSPVSSGRCPTASRTAVGAPFVVGGKCTLTNRFWLANPDCCLVRQKTIGISLVIATLQQLNRTEVTWCGYKQQELINQFGTVHFFLISLQSHWL